MNQFVVTYYLLILVHVSIVSVFQAVKPKSGVFCLLINEARETTALEMPDHENTFVLKV